MNQNRRRKKRPSYGVRTVEIARGRHGFGFTISGQAPCILSCIVSGSPADQAGLRTGDYLIAVNGHNVSKALHDDVVRMIGTCSGLLKIQIAENYYSNSSDDESTPTARPRPKYPHRFRQRQQQQQQHQTGPPATAAVPFREMYPIPSCRRQMPKVVHRHDYKDVPTKIWDYDDEDDDNNNNDSSKARLQSCDCSEPSTSVVPAKAQKKKVEQLRACTSGAWKENRPPFLCEKVIHSIVYPSLQQLQCDSQEAALFKAVVGYLGTIEMPKEPQVAGLRLSAIRSCIRRLRVEKKVHTLVLLKVFGDSVALLNSHGTVLAEYPTSSISFCGAYADDKRFFGLVTTRSETVEELAICSSSCHVFMADPKLVQHRDHQKWARAFHIECTPDMSSSQAECGEFPQVVDPVLVAIVGLYRGQGINIPMDLDVHVSPQPSNTSSNSDSGIGFREEGQNSDRVSMADGDTDYSYLFVAADLRAQLQKNSGSNACSTGVSVVRPKRDSLAKLTLRAMPDPVGFSDVSFNSAHLDAQHDPANVRKSMHKYLQRRMLDLEDSDSLRPVSPTSVAVLPDDLLLQRLSPKVYHDVPVCGQSLCQKDLDLYGIPMLLDDVPESVCEPEGSQDVYPPTQEEDSDCSNPLNEENGSRENAHRWSRAGSFKKSLRLRFGQSKNTEGATLSDGELLSVKESVCGSTMGLDNSSEAGSSGRNSASAHVGRVGSWAICFEKLLSDPAGLHTFAEFLKKEFSHENIAFWVACEQYRQITCSQQMKEQAKVIFEKHLGLGASEPVNVDSHARQLAQDGLESPHSSLFSQAQKQIFNLMKFDCYSRFLKSSLYRECMLKEVAGETLPYLGTDILELGVECSERVNKKSKEKKEEGEDRRRKSLLPWHRTKSGKLKKEKTIKKTDKKDETVISSLSDLTGSRSSLASSDAPPCNRQSSQTSAIDAEQQDSSLLCKLHLPDQSTTIVPVKAGEPVGDWMHHLLSRRSLCYPAIDIYSTDSNRLIDPVSDSLLLAGSEVRVNEMVVFHVELPSKQSVDVRVKPETVLADAIKPVLLKHGFQLNAFNVQTCGKGEPVDMSWATSMVALQKLILVPKCKADAPQPSRAKQQYSLNELTSKVFDDLLHRRRPSIEKMSDVMSQEGFQVSKHNEIDNCSSQPLLGARPRLPHHRRKNSDEMYDLWKKAQCSRLDDQRGTEINFELPEFLKAGAKDGSSGKSQFLGSRPSEPVPSSKNDCRKSLHLAFENVFDPLNGVCRSGLLAGGIIPTHEQADNYFSGSSANREYVRNAQNGLTNNISFSWLSSKNSQRPKMFRPCSHPPQKAPVPWRRSASVPVCEFQTSRESLPTFSVAKEAPAALTSVLKRSLSPSSVPHPTILETSIHGDVADYPPPSPLKAVQEKATAAVTCLSSTDPPPPLPPKPVPLTRYHVPSTQLPGSSFSANSGAATKKKLREFGDEIFHLDNSDKKRGKEPFRIDKFSISFV